jgi:hypothetical protein
MRGDLSVWAGLALHHLLRGFFYTGLARYLIGEAQAKRRLLDASPHGLREFSCEPKDLVWNSLSHLTNLVPFLASLVGFGALVAFWGSGGSSFQLPELIETVARGTGRNLMLLFLGMLGPVAAAFSFREQGGNFFLRCGMGALAVLPALVLGWIALLGWGQIPRPAYGGSQAFDCLEVLFTCLLLERCTWIWARSFSTLCAIPETNRTAFRWWEIDFSILARGTLGLPLVILALTVLARFARAAGLSPPLTNMLGAWLQGFLLGSGLLLALRSQLAKETNGLSEYSPPWEGST